MIENYTVVPFTLNDHPLLHVLCDIRNFELVAKEMAKYGGRVDPGVVVLASSSERRVGRESLADHLLTAHTKFTYVQNEIGLIAALGWGCKEPTGWKMVNIPREYARYDWILEQCERANNALVQAAKLNGEKRSTNSEPRIEYVKVETLTYGTIFMSHPKGCIGFVHDVLRDHIGEWTSCRPISFEFLSRHLRGADLKLFTPDKEVLIIMADRELLPPLTPLDQESKLVSDMITCINFNEPVEIELSQDPTGNDVPPMNTIHQSIYEVGKLLKANGVEFTSEQKVVFYHQLLKDVNNGTYVVKSNTKEI